MPSVWRHLLCDVLNTQNDSIQQAKCAMVIKDNGKKNWETDIGVKWVTACIHTASYVMPYMSYTTVLQYIALYNVVWTNVDGYKTSLSHVSLVKLDITWKGIQIIIRNIVIKKNFFLTKVLLRRPWKYSTDAMLNETETQYGAE